MVWVLIEMKSIEVGQLFQPGEWELAIRTYFDCAGSTYSINRKAWGQSRRNRGLKQCQNRYVSMDPAPTIYPEDRTRKSL